LIYKYGLFYIDYREYLLSNFPPHSDICTDPAFYQDNVLIIRDSNLLLFKFSDVLVFTSRGGNVTNQFKVHGKFSLDSMKVSKSCLIIEQVVMSKSKERKGEKKKEFSFI
jgi:hypothetical protein